MNTAGPSAILVVSHGSPRATTNEGFVSLVGRIAARLDTAEILPAFFSIARPSIVDQVAALVSRGFRRVVLMPYFLYSGQHITQDVPVLLEECRRQFPDVTIELLPTLENDPALEDVVVERLTPVAGGGADPVTIAVGPAIQQRSYQIIARQLAAYGPMEPGAAAVLRRIVHATADLSFARTLRIHPEAIQRGRAALAAGKPVVCDVRMLQAGITKTRNEVLCAIDRDDVVVAAQQNGCTRAAAAIEQLASQLDGALVAIGNAPTALRKVLEIVRAGGPRPAVVVGLPVGFVDAAESKLALLESGLCYITNIGPRGGSPVAAAAVNALATPEEEP
jgi:precorrin-8X/cobalt-precorrin-8 methylmutase